MATEFEGKTAQDVRTRMEEIMAQRGEGLVIKHPDSEYVLNGRNKDWIKVSVLLVPGETRLLIDWLGQTRVYGRL